MEFLCEMNARDLEMCTLGLTNFFVNWQFFLRELENCQIFCIFVSRIFLPLKNISIPIFNKNFQVYQFFSKLIEKLFHFFNKKKGRRRRVSDFSWNYERMKEVSIYCLFHEHGLFL